MRRIENKIRYDRNEQYIPVWEVKIGLYDCNMLLYQLIQIVLSRENSRIDVALM